MTLVASVATASTPAGSMLAVSSSTSTKVMRAPSARAQEAVATNVIGVVTTSSPAETPAAAYAMCRAAVPEVALTQRVAPERSCRASSNAVTVGPVVSKSPRSTCATASTSSWLTDCRPYGITSDTRLEHLADLVGADPDVVLVGGAVEALGDRHAVGAGHVAPRRELRLEDVVLAVHDHDGAAALLRADHLLVELLAGAQADVVHLRAGRDRLREVGDEVRGDVRHDELAALHERKGVEHHLHGLGQRDEEARAAQVGDGQRLPRLVEGAELRDDRAARAGDVAVAHDREAGRVLRGVVVAEDEELVGGQLGRAVEVDRRARLVGRERDDLLDAGVDARLDDVLATEDVGLDELVRVVLARVDLLEGGGVHDVVGAVHGPAEAVEVADVTDEPAQARVVVEQLTDLPLLQLVTAVDDDPLGVVVVEHLADERLAKGPGPTCDEDRRPFENAHPLTSWSSTNIC